MAAPASSTSQFTATMPIWLNAQRARRKALSASAASRREFDAVELRRPVQVQTWILQTNQC